MVNLILGIDDAGRGPLIGPMILAGVLVSSEQEKFLKKQNVADSKLLAHPTRIALAKVIKEHCKEFKIVKSTATEIDDSINSGTNLNTLEAMKTAEIINSINQKDYTKQNIKVIVDCPSTNTTAWKNKLMSFLKHPNNLSVYCEHKADVNHTSVSAASIIAKVAREDEVSKLKKQYEKYGNLGSGYPSDPFTKEFLKAHGKELADSGIFRKTWSTWKSLYPDKKEQATLDKF
jgi:ribonuclease HII